MIPDGRRGWQRVVIATLTPEVADPRAMMVAGALRDFGVEVIYTGSLQTPEQIVETATQEDANAVVISIVSDAQAIFVRQVVELLRKGTADVHVAVTGLISDEVAAELREQSHVEVSGREVAAHRLVELLEGVVPG